MKRSIEWAAGLFEGEGTIGTERKGARMSIEMTDKDIVEAFQEIAGDGSIITRQRFHWKPTYTWRTGKREVIKKLLSDMLPYFGHRRAHKALDVLDHLELQM